MNLMRCLAQLRFEPPHPAVLYAILQSFLQDAEEAKCNLLWERVWDLITDDPALG
jgi:hypothetical protein